MTSDGRAITASANCARMTVALGRVMAEVLVSGRFYLRCRQSGRFFCDDERWTGDHCERALCANDVGAGVCYGGGSCVR